MATASVARRTAVSVEAYLNTAYKPDCDYVDGELERRNVGEDIHSAWQLAVMAWFLRHPEWPVLIRPEIRIKISGRRYRVADVAILDERSPRDPVVIQPPLAVFEVVSRLDRYSRITARLLDFESLGVPQIWLLHPRRGTMQRFVDGEFQPASEFALDEQGIRFPMERIRELVK